LLQNSSTWGSRRIDANDRMHDSDLYLFPTTHVTEPSTFLWYPWAVAFTRSIAEGGRADRAADVATATATYQKLRARAGEFGSVASSEYNYVAAEGLIAFGWPVGNK
jgi:hypothetical protein